MEIEPAEISFFITMQILPLIAAASARLWPDPRDHHNHAPPLAWCDVPPLGDTNRLFKLKLSPSSLCCDWSLRKDMQYLWTKSRIRSNKMLLVAYTYFVDVIAGTEKALLLFLAPTVQ
jgi:hypothetical protein